MVKLIKQKPKVKFVKILTQIRPNGARQPVAEAWVLIKLNMQLFGHAPQNDRNWWP